ncbi:hypothetical protein V1318_08420 [Lysobacter sp. CCNWLW3]|uniref:hypothetical protein n=1 Tax=unclassified Lysobacter TaxID=2635362 RepID=UPI002FD64346
MRLTKILFGLSDLCAWMLMTVAVLGAVAVLFLGPAPDAKPVSSLESMALSLLWVLVAAGAYLLTRRRPLGLLLVILPVFVWLVQGDAVPALAYAAFALLVFATPLILVWREVRRGA